MPAINRGLEEASALTDPQARARAFGALDRRITALAPAAAINWQTNAVLRSRDVVGVVNGYTGGWDLSFTALR